MSVQAKTLRPFNTPVESGFRMMFLLSATYPAAYSLERLAYYDYLIVHSGDVDGAPASLHPPLPHRSGEQLVHHAVIANGLNLMFSRELIDKLFDANGITYRANHLTQPLLSHLKSEYALQLQNRAEWIAKTFKNVSDDEIAVYMRDHLTVWGAEYKLESVIRGLEHE